MANRDNDDGDDDETDGDGDGDGDGGGCGIMKCYRAKRSTLVLTFGFLGILTALTVFGVFYAEPRLFFVAFLFVLAWRWNQLLKTAVEVRARDDRVIEFRGVIGRKELSVDRIRRVMRVGRGYWIEHGDGSINLYGNMEGIDEFLAQLRALNPALEVKRYTPWSQKN
ncbi:MAG: hypothetical protein GTO46_13745 [Gemmatimonadetes bacterium]|nr:hypothetical protein [Gemmatimonadota bacterium]NIO32645.1 hypothetical protein [Gemmatimonadota bacterium]